MQVATRDIQWETQSDGTVTAHLTLVAVAMDGHGKPLANNVKDVVARLKTTENLAQTPFATLSIGVPQGKNAKSIRIAVRDVSTGKLGTTEVGLTAPR